MHLPHTIASHLPGFAVDVFRLALWLVLLSVIFVPVERLFALRHQRTGRLGRRAVWADLGFYFLNSLLPAILLSMPMALLAAAVQRLMPPALPAALAALPLPARLALALLVGEIGFYWGHRLSHEIAWLWRFHAVHHTPEHMYFLVNTRAHPVDMVVTRLFGLTPLYMLGLAGTSVAGAATPIWLTLVGTFWGFFIHSNLRLRFGPLEWLVATPAFHHWHHSRRDPINRNYAATLPLLDRLFGTHYLPRAWPAEYGIDDGVDDAARTATGAAAPKQAG